MGKKSEEGRSYSYNLRTGKVPRASASPPQERRVGTLAVLAKTDNGMHNRPDGPGKLKSFTAEPPRKGKRPDQRQPRGRLRSVPETQGSSERLRPAMGGLCGREAVRSAWWGVRPSLRGPWGHPKGTGEQSLHVALRISGVRPTPTADTVSTIPCQPHTVSARLSGLSSMNP